MADLKTYKFTVEMTCEGCVNAVKRCLTKAFGDRLSSVDTDLSSKSVVVVIDNSAHHYSHDDVFEAIKKCGKEVHKVD
ncbi:unnamed protein product [Oppiella nova]|uniref:Copper transport protein ATOX1 n=1 Tax=Oppiella nova TaxID=334625 RepID=A0A7R9LL76_9ACAR|nr:unnamed protein product [Oppiella nova]CAG2164744.1 unnamed protein product [Oppiella nova]